MITLTIMVTASQDRGLGRGLGVPSNDLFHCQVNPLLIEF